MSNSEPSADPPGAAATAATLPGTPVSTDDGAATPPTRGDRVLLVVFWVWAALLLLATLAQIFEWDAVIDLLDVKRWFGR